MAYEHGTTSRYTAKRCRCEACKTAWRSYMRDYYAKNRKPAPDQLRACDNCNQFYVAKLTSRQKFCNPSCNPKTSATSRILTCTKCGNGYSQRQTHHSVTAPVCDTCLADLVATGTVCPICELPWWAPKTNHCCGVECQELFDAKQQMVEASR